MAKMFMRLSEACTLYAATLILLLTTLYIFACVIYNLHFHPLAKFNGPPFWCASRLGYVNSMLRGNLVADVKRLHERYGDIVRLAPNELSFARKDAWNDVYAKRAGHKTFGKNPIFFKAPLGQPENLVTTTNLADHARMRKAIEPAFTEGAVLRQEPVIQFYLDLLIHKLDQVVENSQKQGKEAVIDITNWYNFYTFDTIGDLGLGESFGSLERTDYHPWVSLIFNYLKGMTILAATRFYPLVELILLRLLPPSIKKLQADHYRIAQDKIHRRINLPKEREDLMTSVLKDNPGFSKMSLEEIESTFSILIVAGSETTATVLSGITNELVKAPAEMEKLVKEVRGTFRDESEITLSALKKLPFLTAVCQEGLRLCNPVPGGLPRLVPAGGDTVCGHFLPENVMLPLFSTFPPKQLLFTILSPVNNPSLTLQTNVSVSPTALSLSLQHFFHAERFLPDRFLPAAQRRSEFASDQLSNQQPFSLGPRACIGKALAWAQMRAVLARIVWCFDIEVVEGKELDWGRQKTFFVVQKEGVWVRIRRRGKGRGALGHG